MTDLEALALTIWGEARGEPIEGKIGVAMVMRNRLQHAYLNGKTYVDVCTAHAQFSAWTEEAAQLQQMLTAYNHPGPVLGLCIEVARGTMTGKLADNTSGANHYYADTIPAPAWAVGTPLAHLGHHLFFNVA